MKKKMVKLKPRTIDDASAKQENIGNRVLADLKHKPKKIAKTYSVSAHHHELLEQWCEDQGSTSPSNIVDSLIKIFLKDQGLL